MLNGLKNADSRKGVLFGNFVDITLHFVGEIVQKQFWWREQTFSSQTGKILEVFILSKLLHQFQQNFAK